MNTEENNAPDAEVSIIENNADLAEISVFWGEVVWLVSKLLLVIFYVYGNFTSGLVLVLITWLIFGKVIFFVYAGPINTHSVSPKRKLVLFVSMLIIAITVNWMSWYITKSYKIAATFGIILTIFSVFYWLIVLAWSASPKKVDRLEICLHLIMMLLCIYALFTIVTNSVNILFLSIFGLAVSYYAFEIMRAGVFYYWIRTKEVIKRVNHS